MRPALRSGDVMLLSYEFDSVEVGDIIIFHHRWHGRNFVHRVVEIRHDGKIITQGDNNLNPDSVMITPDNFVGKVVMSVSFRGVVRYEV